MIYIHLADGFVVFLLHFYNHLIGTYDMSLREILASKTTIYEDVDPAWRTFVRDHKQELVQNSVLNELTADKAYQVKCNPTRFFRDIGYRTDFVWIAMYVNDLATDVDFGDVRSIYVPNVDYIMQMYSQYRISKASNK